MSAARVQEAEFMDDIDEKAVRETGHSFHCVG